MESTLELMGLWVARLYAVYGVVFLLLPTLAFLYLPLLGGLVWAAIARERGRPPRYLSPRVRRWGRLGIEIAFGLINPTIYLAILTLSMPAMRRDAEAWWFSPLTTIAWLLLATLWIVRIFGGARVWFGWALRRCWAPRSCAC